ncbi:glycosyltransferase family 2 protein [Streptomyces sp. CC77]|uniref:glycosyltransferase family 2 protein n=1 Tax=Streptomyces sp. CC77 TaxID=1906739 RepID=UPI0008DD3F18|nr:glycosyltransferase [Streptomyces sp. CC77]OII68411.1 transferase [Streptomyces sp. CC77]
MSPPPAAYAVVVPTVGRPCLADCLAALAASEGPEPARIVVVDDRPGPPAAPLPLDSLGGLADRAAVLRSGGRGPAAARNTGLRAAGEPWTVFLDDDVRVSPTWRADLARDLDGASPDTGGVQGVLRVPQPADRRPTDWERNTAGLERALWVTADMAYRTEALRAVGGFDERFPRAFREDADLALRVLDAGWLIRRGRRRTDHPVRPAGRWVSRRTQRGNADDALMARLHGPDWWERAAAPRGRIRRHAAVAAAGGLALLLGAFGRRRAAGVAAAGWLLGTAEFAWARIAPGPRTRDEVGTMAATSALIPFLAVWHRLSGEVRYRSAGCWNGGADGHGGDRA